MPFLIFQSLLGLKADECMATEDSENGKISAEKAGIEGHEL